MVRAVYLEFLDPKDESLADELDAWLDATHVPEMLKLPGTVCAVRGVISPDQQPGMSGPRHRFLTMFHVDTGDLPSYVAALTVTPSTSTPALDVQRPWRVVYLQLGERHLSPGPDNGKTGALRLLSLVFVGPKDPRHIEDYSLWMEDPHVPEMLAVPGCVAGTRYHYSSDQPINSVGPNHPFLNFWEVETSSGEEYQRQLKAHPRTPTSAPIVDVEHIQHVNYVRL